MIDVSSWQGRVDWSKVYRDGVRKAGVKATEGVEIVDPFAAANVKAARKAGVDVFVYHFAHPSNPPLQEAHHFLATVRKLGLIHQHDIVPHLDLETTEGLDDAQLRRWAVAFLNAVKGTVGDCGLYSDASFLHAIDADTIHCPVWGADYRAQPWNPPAYWWAWQHSCTGRVLGVKGDVDVSVVKHAPPLVAHPV